MLDVYVIIQGVYKIKVEIGNHRKSLFCKSTVSTDIFAKRKNFFIFSLMTKNCFFIKDSIFEEISKILDHMYRVFMNIKIKHENVAREKYCY